MGRSLKAIERAIELAAGGDLPLARHAMNNVDREVVPKTRGRKLSMETKMEAYIRDNFTCRYCGSRLFATPIFRLLSEIDPNGFPYDPSWQMTRCHKYYWKHTPSADHVVAVAQGGSNELANLLTACYRCNSIKSVWTLKEVGFVIRPITRERWNGAMSHLEPMANALGRGRAPWVREWLRPWERLAAAG